MRRCRRVLPVIILCLCTLGAYGQQSWQGTAAVARSGEFVAPGMVAASNAFPENTTILVRNAQSGQSVQVTVTQRIQGTSSVFMLLSEEAGKQIGLTGSQLIRVQASVVSTLGADISDSLREEAYSRDPDLNPPMSVTEEQLLSSPVAAPEAEEVAAVEEPSAETAAEPVEAEEPSEPESVVAEEQPAEIAQTGAETPAAAEPTPEEKRLQEVSDRIPQKQLYMPPRQQEVYALAPEPSQLEEPEREIGAAEPIAEEATQVEEQPPAEVIVEEPPEVAAEVEEPEEAIEVVEEGPPRVSMLGPEVEEVPLEVALPGPEATEPEKPSPEGTRLPAPEEQPPLAVAPEEPPTGEFEGLAPAEEVVEPVVEEQPAEEEVAAAEAAPEEATVLSELLPSRTYFVQLGAYSTRTSAENLAGDLTKSYSVTILPADSGGRRFYKVLVGPLNVDESGTLLYQFRSLGFKDAFIQYVE
jgi:rare lipoprotein A (peptidoglycan hydrolase)